MTTCQTVIHDSYNPSKKTSTTPTATITIPYDDCVLSVNEYEEKKESCAEPKKRGTPKLSSKKNHSEYTLHNKKVAKDYVNVVAEPVETVLLSAYSCTDCTLANDSTRKSAIAHSVMSLSTDLSVSMPRRI